MPRNKFKGFNLNGDPNIVNPNARYISHIAKKSEKHMNNNKVRIGKKKGIEGFIDNHGRHFIIGGIAYGVSYLAGSQKPLETSVIVAGVDFGIKHFIEKKPIY